MSDTTPTNKEWLAFHGHSGYSEEFATRVRHLWRQSDVCIDECVNICRTVRDNTNTYPPDET